MPASYTQTKINLSLFDLEADPGETTDLAKDHPEVVKRLMKLVEKERGELGDSLTGIRGSGNREPGRLPKE